MGGGAQRPRLLLRRRRAAAVRTRLPGRSVLLALPRVCEAADWRDHHGRAGGEELVSAHCVFDAHGHLLHRVALGPGQFDDGPARDARKDGALRREERGRGSAQGFRSGEGVGGRPGGKTTTRFGMHTNAHNCALPPNELSPNMLRPAHCTPMHSPAAAAYGWCAQTRQRRCMRTPPPGKCLSWHPGRPRQHSPPSWQPAA